MKALPSQLQTEMFQPERKSYFNTVSESPTEVRTFEATAKAQDERIFSQFTTGRQWTADELHDELKTIMLTSVRRSLSTLSAGGFIMVVGKKKGNHDRNVLIWKMKPIGTNHH